MSLKTENEILLSSDGWELINEHNGVKLYEVGIGVYIVEYWEGVWRRRPVFFSWPAAQANYTRRAEEAGA